MQIKLTPEIQQKTCDAVRAGNYLATAAATGVEDRACGHRAAQHVFQTNRLGGELKIIVQPFPFGAVFVFDWINGSIRPEFHHVALAYQPQPIRPHRQGILDTRATAQRFMRGTIDPLVFRVAAHGVNVVSEFAFLMNQAATAWAIYPVVKR